MFPFDDVIMILLQKFTDEHRCVYLTLVLKHDVGPDCVSSKALFDRMMWQGNATTKGGSFPVAVTWNQFLC